jgi:serine/threonine protein kinase/WD40 repeat protein
MSESCTKSYSGGCDESTGGEVDEIIVRFLKELEGSGDARKVLQHYCEAYPAMAGEFRALAGARQVLVMSEPVADVEAGHIGRLGDFQIVRQIARGGMGAIYEAIQEPFQRRVAVKTIRGDRHHLSAGARDRFFREQAVLARLHHTHIVPIHAGGQDGDLQYFAMPYIEGAALHHVVRFAWQHEATRPSEETPSLAELVQGVSGGSPAPEAGDPSAETTPVETGGHAGSTRDHAKLILSAKYLRSVAKVMAEAGDALYHAHQVGVIHRDVKPSNIMVDTHEHCWVLDFGLAAYRAARDGEVNQAGLGELIDGAASGVMGTPRYMAPEQFQERADARTDVWGLGVTLYELLTLRPAFASRAQIESSEPHRPREFVGNLPRDLEAICLKALGKDPQRRYATAREFADDLRRWLAHEPVRARRAQSLRRAALWARRNKGWAAAIVVGLIALALTAVGGLLVGKIRADSAQAVAAAAQASAKAQRREALLQRLIHMRLSTHDDGWSERAWDLIRETAALGIDEDLKAQAAATLAGLDARRAKTFRDFGGYSVAFDRQGTRLLIASTTPKPSVEPNGVRLWKTEAMQPEVLTETGEGPVAFRADGTPVQLAIEVNDGGARTLSLRELTGRRAVTRFTIPGRLDDPNPGQVALSPDLALAAAPVTSAEGQPALAVWDAATGRLRHRFEGPTSAAAFSPDGSLTARGDDDGRITVWSLPRGEQVASLRSGRNAIRVLAFARDPLRRTIAGPSGDGRGWLLAAGDQGGGVSVWDVGAGVPRAYCRGSPYGITAIAFSPDGQTLASGGRSVLFWDLATGRLLLHLEFAADFAYGLAFSPDGRRLAVGGVSPLSELSVQVWDLEPHRGVQALHGLVSEASKIAFSPDGRLVAALGHDWQVAVWDRTTGALRHVLEAPKGLSADNAALAFDHDGRRFAFATSGRAVLWDLDTGRELNSWALPRSLLDTLAFHRSGKLLLGRLETRDRRRGPFGDAPAREHPRVYRVRDLLGPDPVDRPLCEINDTNWHAYDAAAPPDGRYFVVDGLGGPDVSHRRVVVFDPLTGKVLFETTPLTRARYSAIGLDPTGRVLRLDEVGDGRESRSTLLEMPSGRRLRSLERGWSALGPDASLWAALGEPVHGNVRYGFILHDREGRHLVDLGIDSQTPASGHGFDTDGHTFAWSSTEGTVYLANLNEVQRRLAAVGLDW